MINGSAGIPRKGREEEYATELWLEDPTAFWLHPEGPLSDTTPDEWKAKQVKEGLDLMSQTPHLHGLRNTDWRSFQGQMAQAALAQAQAQSQLSAYRQAQNASHLYGRLFGSLIP